MATELNTGYHLVNAAGVEIGGNIMREGSITFGGELTQLFFVEHCPAGLLPCINVCHKNQVRYLFYDAHNQRLFVKRWSRTLGETRFLRAYLAGLGSLVCTFRGSIRSLIPPVRKAFSEIVAYVVDMHDLGFTLGCFTLDNLIVERGVVKFVNVELLRLGDPNRDNDFANVRAVFRELVPIDGGNVPAEYADFHHVASLNIDEAAERHLRHHLCLKSPDQMCRFLKNIGATINDNLMRRRLSDAYNHMGDLLDWDRNLGMAEYVELMGVFNHGGGNNEPYLVRGILRHVASSFRSFIRNCMVHSQIRAQPGVNGVWKLQAIVLAPFVTEMCSLQRWLCGGIGIDHNRWF